METKKLTIHRALAELKLIDAKIARGIESIIPIGMVQGTQKKVNGISSEEDFTKQAASDFQSITDLIERKVKIKSAIVASNAITTVTVATKSMSVANAITSKSLAVLKQQFIDKLKTASKTTFAAINRNNDVVNANLQKCLEATLGKDSVKASKEDIDAIREPFMKANEYQLFDPIQLNKKIEVLVAELTEFQAEVDAVLSESNATTFIEI